MLARSCPKPALLSVMLSIPAVGQAQETTIYRYDTLGRLIEARVSGGFRDGLMASVTFDPLGNRLRFVVSGADGSGTTPPPPSPPPPSPPPPSPPPPSPPPPSPPPPPPSPPPPSPPPPPPPPPPPNSPPVTVIDALSVAKCGYGEVNVIANDTDPEGDLPLALIDVESADPANSKGAPIMVSATTMGFEATQLGLTGTDTVIYRVRDGLGAVASGTVKVTIRTNGLCFQDPQQLRRQPP